MKYQVIARKFRPQVFEDVVGQKPIVQTLQNAIQLKRIGHAYMFSGPRGVGKTTMARILAKCLNCSQGPAVTPCNECSSCKEIAAGQSLDVLEIDAASNTGVDSIRELRESARYAPSRDRYKIFIIDEVHMLSTSAFNALLKVLEEPPAHIVFVMATTERHKLPATILSRCQQFVFRTIAAVEIQARLREIASSEGIRIDDGALAYIVRAAEGSMRDAQSLLDQIISFSGQEVVDEDVQDVLGFIPAEILSRTLDALVERDSKGLLTNAGIVVDQGLNLQQFVREFIGKIRDLLMLKLGLDDRVLGSTDEKKALAALVARFSEQDLIRFFDMLLRLENDLRWTSQPRFHLELGLVKLAKVGQVRDIEEVIREMRNGDPAGQLPTAPPKDKLAASQPPDPPPVAEAAPVQPFADVYTGRVEEKSATTALHLQKANRIERSSNGVEIRVGDPTSLALLESKEHKHVLDTVASELIGKAVSVSLIMKKPRTSSSGRSAPEAENALESAKQEPLVKRFLEVFRGDLAQVKPEKGE